jgi:broad specificity phosphatase PhoE
MSRALLLRHGESASNAHTGTETLSDEQGDRLTELGQAQARSAGAAIGEHRPTRLLCSPMRRARETAAAIGEALELEPAVLDYVHELQAGEEFERVVARVQRLKAELESAPDGDLPLLVSHGIFIRFFLFDSVLGEGFAASMAGQVWQLGSHNCGLSVFARGESRYPSGEEISGWTCLSWMQRPWDPP